PYAIDVPPLHHTCLPQDHLLTRKTEPVLQHLFPLAGSANTKIYTLSYTTLFRSKNLHRRNCRFAVCTECAFAEPIPQGNDGNQAGNQNGHGMRPLLRERARRKIRARDKNQGLQARCPGSGGTMGGTKRDRKSTRLNSSHVAISY